MIEFACASCGQIFKVKDDWAGKRARCKKCGDAVEVPVTEEPLDLFHEPEALPQIDGGSVGFGSRALTTMRSVLADGRWLYAPLLVVFVLSARMLLIAFRAFSNRLSNDDGLPTDNQLTAVVVINLILFAALWVLFKALKRCRSKCPYCAEPIKPEARVCKHCGNAIVRSARLPSHRQAPIAVRSAVPTSSGLGWPKTGGQWAIAIVLGLTLGGGLIALKLPADRRAAAEKEERVRLIESIKGDWYEVDPENIRLGLPSSNHILVFEHPDFRNKELRIRFLSHRTLNPLSDSSPYENYLHAYFSIEDGDAEQLQGRWKDERPAGFVEDKGTRIIRLKADGNLQIEGEPHAFSRHEK